MNEIPQDISTAFDLDTALAPSRGSATPSLFDGADYFNVIAEAAQEIWNEIKLGPRLDTPERRAERESYAVEAAMEFGFVADENDLPNGTYIATGPQIFALLEHVEKHARLPSMTFPEWMTHDDGNEAGMRICDLVGDRETIAWMRAAWDASLSRTFGRKAR